MCGIIGYVGKKQAANILLEGLIKLEYRGYDSAGIAVISKDKKIDVTKKLGQISCLQAQIEKFTPEGNIGIGHSRWATHGCPSDENAHPHTDCTGKFAVVHNGIIENYIEVRQALEKNHNFKSETDTEILIHLVEECYEYKKDFRLAVIEAIKLLKGSFALAFLCSDEPDKIICTKKDNPMVLGIGIEENFIASDIPAIIRHTRKAYILNDEEVAIISYDKIHVTDLEGNKIKKKIFEVNWNAEAAEKSGYEHFMLKEIYEQPKALKETMRGRIIEIKNNIVLDELNWTFDFVKNFNKIVIVACGTSYYAGLIGKFYLQEFSKISVEVYLGSEFRYSNHVIDNKTLAIFISQSGETLDTLAALRESKKLGVLTLAITNVVGSTAAREADNVLYTWAGPEIAVASTKAYTTQIVLLCLFALYFSFIRKNISNKNLNKFLKDLQNLPNKVHEIFKNIAPIKTIAALYNNTNDIFYLGRLLDYAVAQEGALKLKELSYIHAEAYAAGELKHGTLALIEEGIPVFAIATQKCVFNKMMGNVKEVKARGAKVIGITFAGNEEIEKYVDHTIYIPVINELLAPILAVIPLQFYAYYSAINRNCDVDKPRNLAKSVTVE